MSVQKIQKSFIAYRFTLVITVIVFIVWRLPGKEDWLSIHAWGSSLVQIIIALFLLYFNQAFGIIRYKTLLPAFFYLLLAGTNLSFSDNLTGSISTLIIVLCLLFLFSSYQNPLSQAHAFNISLLLTLGSFYWLPILYFFPLLWYGMYLFKSFNFKTFFASLTGFALIYLFLFTWSIYKDNLDIFWNALPHFSTIGDIRFFSFETRTWVITGWFILLFVLSGIKIFMAGVSEKIQSITILSYLYILTIILFGLFFIQNQWAKEWLSLLYVPLSLLYAHYFTLSSRLWVSWLFVLTVVLRVTVSFLDILQ